MCEEFNVILTFTGAAQLKYCKSHHVQLCKTIKNCLNYYGDKELQTPPYEPVEFNFDVTGTGVEVDNCQVNRLTKHIVLSHQHHLGLVF
jgi:hypothetical protein